MLEFNQPKSALQADALSLDQPALKWGGRRGTIPQQPASQAGALPVELRPPSVDESGACGRKRSDDLQFTKLTLFQLSYTGEMVGDAD